MSDRDPQSAFPGTDFLPVSVWHSGGKARAPMLSPITPASRHEWLAELTQIRDLGFNAVRTWITWADGEPQEGEHRHDNLRLLCELAAQVELRVILQLYTESAPAWIEERHPDAAFVTQSGERLRSQSVPGLCTDHPGVREAMLRFCRATAAVAAEHPNFHGWDLWSEPHIANWIIIRHVPHVQLCHCEHTCQRFQRWLRERHGTLENLATAWGRRLTDWEQARPPQFGTILTYTDFLDWRAFIFDKMAEDLRMRADAVRESDPNHVITSHAAVPSGMTSPLSEWGGYGATDDFLMTRAVDQYGLSLYPKHSFPDRHWEDWKIDFALSFARSANRHGGGYVVGELQAGAGARGVIVGDPVTASDLRRWIWTCLAHGAKAVNIFAWHPMASGYEAGGYGLIGVDGSATERAEAAGEIARVVTRHMPLFAQSRPVPAEVAIVYNPLAQLMGGEQSCGPTSMHSDSLMGYHRALADQGVPVDFIHRRDLESGDLPPLRLIILPHPIMLTREAAEGLRRFVEAGGCVVAEARLAWVNECGFTAGALPGLGLSEVFGAREVWTKTRERVTLTLDTSSHPAVANFETGATLTGAHFAEALEPLPGHETQILARLDDGSPAMVASQFGAGQTVLIGTFLGMAHRLCPEENHRRLIRNLVHWAGVEPPFTTSQSERAEPPLLTHLHTSPEGWLLYLVNRRDREEPITVTIPTDNHGKRQVTDLITDEPMPISQTEQELTIDTTVEGHGVKVLSIPPR